MTGISLELGTERFEWNKQKQNRKVPFRPQDPVTHPPLPHMYFLETEAGLQHASEEPFVHDSTKSRGNIYIWLSVVDSARR